MIKQDIVTQSLVQCGLSSMSNPASNEMIKNGLQILERKMSALSSTVDVGYIFSADISDPGPTEESGINANLIDSVISYITIPICESLAAPYTPETKQASMMAYKSLLARALIPNKTLPVNMPSGAGNRRYNEDYNYMLKELSEG